MAADEAACTAEDVRRIAQAGAAQIINIKLMKAGVAEALDLVAAARESGLGLMIGGNVESILAMTVSACFACGLGGFSYADLDTPLFLATNPFDGGFTLDGGTDLGRPHHGRTRCGAKGGVSRLEPGSLNPVGRSVPGSTTPATTELGALRAPFAFA